MREKPDYCSRVITVFTKQVNICMKVQTTRQGKVTTDVLPNLACKMRLRKWKFCSIRSSQRPLVLHGAFCWVLEPSQPIRIVPGSIQLAFKVSVSINSTGFLKLFQLRREFPFIYFCHDSVQKHS